MQTHRDGKISIEQQLSIFLVDLYSYLEPLVARTPPAESSGKGEIGDLDIRGIHEVLVGLDYVVEYRIRGGRQPSLDADICQRLTRLLLLISGYRKSVKGGERIFKRSNNRRKARMEMNTEADTAFLLLFSLAGEVQECRQALAEVFVADLRQRLKLHLRLLEAGTPEKLQQTLVILFTLVTEYPHLGEWRELVKTKHHRDVEGLLQEAGFFEDRQREEWRAFLSSNKSAQLDTLKPPQALHFDRETARVLDMFHTSLTHGLNESIVGEREAFYGRNEIARAPKKSVLRMFMTQVADFMIAILLLAALASLAVDWPNPTTFLILVFVVIVNVSIGLVQEWRAARAVETITASTLQAQSSRVIRGGYEQSIPSSSLVPGDIVLINEGDGIPADLRLATCTRFACIETMLTGESEPVSKATQALRVKSRRLPLTKCTGNAFMGTVAARGNAIGIVVRIGEESELGRISKAIIHGNNSIQNGERKSPLQAELGMLSRVLVALAVVLCILVGLAGILWGNPPLEMIKVAVSLAVSVIPEGLLAVVTVCMALAMARLAKDHHAIVRRATAIEQLASMELLCSDKTGTLTEGRMKVQRVWTPSHHEESSEQGNRLVWECSAMCNNVRWHVKTDSTLVIGAGDTTEVALLEASLRDSSVLQTIEASKRILECPFDSDRRMMSVLAWRSGEAFMLYTKGAPEVIMERSVACILNEKVVPLNEQILGDIGEAQSELSELGLRVLGLAYKHIQVLPKNLPVDITHPMPIDTPEDTDDLESDLVFIGLVGIADPPRQGIKEAIEECKRLGCQVAMITGDHAQTAMAIAKQLGLSPEDGSLRVMRGRELDALGEEGLARMHPLPSVFARVSPQNKLQIVRALQNRLTPRPNNALLDPIRTRSIVAMTGDGVNDAPAISAADVGIAMGGPAGADICRHAAALILSDDNFAAIPAAIQEGRRSIANIAKFIAYLMACNSAEIWCVAIPVAIVNLPAPLSAINILWANIIADVPPSMALGAGEPAEVGKTGMRRRRDLDEEGIAREGKPPAVQYVLDTRRIILIVSQGFIIAALTLSIYFHSLYEGGLMSAAFTHGARFDESMLISHRSEAFFILTSLQLIVAFCFKSLDHSLLTRNPFDNIPLLLCVLLSFALLVCGHYVPGLRECLELKPVGALTWIKMCISAVLMIVLNEITKLVVMRRVKR